MRIAVSGSHGTGKTTLIGAFLGRRPEYVHEPEAFEALGDEIDLDGNGPTPEGLEALLRHTIAAVAARAATPHVVFERSPVDYLAYAAASRRTWDPDAVAGLLRELTPLVRESVRQLDLITLLPVSRTGPILVRSGEDARFRARVDKALRAALIDDEYDLFAEGRTQVSELSPVPERQLAELLRLTEAPAG